MSGLRLLQAAALAWLLCAGAPPAAAQLPEAQPGCSGAAAARCYAEGLALSQGAFRGREDPGPAVRLLLGACAGGVGDGCYLAGRLTETVPETDTSTAAIDTAASRALRLYARGCNAAPQPSASACSAAGDVYTGWPGLAELDSALRYLERGCALRNATACLGSAELMDDWSGPGPPRPSLPLRRMREACEGGSPEACLAVARRTEARLRQAPPAERATAAFREQRRSVRRAYTEACGDMLLAGCTLLGTLFSEGAMGIAPSPDSARHYFTRACTAGGDRMEGVGDGAACARLGRLFAGAGRPEGEAAVDTARAIEHFTLGCRLLDPGACADLAVYGVRFGRVPRHEALLRAVTACNEGGSAGCRAAGWLYTQDLSADRGLSRLYLARGCGMDDGAACDELAEAVLEADPAAAAKYTRRACALGSGTACMRFAAMLAEFGRPPEAVAAFHARACDAGWWDGCRQMVRHAHQAGREEEAGAYQARACMLNAAACKGLP